MDQTGNNLGDLVYPTINGVREAWEIVTKDEKSVGILRANMHSRLRNLIEPTPDGILENVKYPNAAMRAAGAKIVGSEEKARECLIAMIEAVQEPPYGKVDSPSTFKDSL